VSADSATLLTVRRKNCEIICGRHNAVRDYFVKPFGSRSENGLPIYIIRNAEMNIHCRPKLQVCQAYLPNQINVQRSRGWGSSPGLPEYFNLLEKVSVLPRCTLPSELIWSHIRCRYSICQRAQAPRHRKGLGNDQGASSTYLLRRGDRSRIRKVVSTAPCTARIASRMKLAVFVGSCHFRLICEVRVI
jgi:hypothetical protein